MPRRLTFTLALAVLCAAWIAAAPPAADVIPNADKADEAKTPNLAGTILSLEGIRVEIAVEGEKPAWVKKGAGIKLADVKGGLGKIVDVSATSVTFNTRKASGLKVGDKVAVAKGKVVPAGC